MVGIHVLPTSALASCSLAPSHSVSLNFLSKAMNFWNNPYSSPRSFISSPVLSSSENGFGGIPNKRCTESRVFLFASYRAYLKYKLSWNKITIRFYSFHLCTVYSSHFTHVQETCFIKRIDEEHNRNKNLPYFESHAIFVRLPLA